MIAAVGDDVDEADHESSAARAVTQPKLCGRIVSHHPGTGVPPYEATRSVISASDSGPAPPQDDTVGKAGRLRSHVHAER